MWRVKSEVKDGIAGYYVEEEETGARNPHDFGCERFAQICADILNRKAVEKPKDRRRRRWTS